MPNCPICGRHIGEFSDDPLFANPSLSTDDYKGFTTLLTTHIIELQTERHQQEIDAGVTPLTEFSPINDTGFFQNIKQYILELRDSTEKILVLTGMTLEEFLSTDEDGNPMTTKEYWTDSNLEEIKYQCKAIHIEDLRHYISVGIFSWIEDWFTMKDYPIYVDEDPTEYNVPFLFDILTKQESGSFAVGFEGGYGTIYINTRTLSGTNWSGDKPFSGSGDWEDTFRTYWDEGLYYTVTKTLDKSFQDHYINVRSIFNNSVPANLYPSLGGASYWEVTSVPVYNPDIYFKKLGIEKKVLFQTISSGSISSSMSGQNPINYRSGRIYIKVRVSFIGGSDRYVIYYLGTNYVPAIDPTLTYVAGINNLNSNLTNIIKNAFPSLWSSAIDVVVREISMGYKMEIDCPPLHLYPTPTPARNIQWNIAFTVDKLTFIQSPL